jgi:hypothetical protein
MGRLQCRSWRGDERGRFGHYSLLLCPRRFNGKKEAKLFNPVKNGSIEPEIGPAPKWLKLLND